MARKVFWKTSLANALALIALAIMILSFLSTIGFQVRITLIRITHLTPITPLTGAVWLDLAVSGILMALAGLIVAHIPTLIISLISALIPVFSPNFYGEAVSTILISTALILVFTKLIKRENVLKESIAYAVLLVGLGATIYWVVLIVNPAASVYLKILGRFEAYLTGALAPITAGAYVVLFSLAAIQLIKTCKAGKTDKPIENRIWLNERKLLALGMLAAITIPLIPYIPWLNPERTPVNVDWIFYLEALKQIREEGLKAIFKAYWGSRPLYLLILYTASRLLKIDLQTTSIYHNLILLPLYALSIWFLAKPLFGRKTATYALLITAISPTYVGFILGGLQANLFALSLINMALGIFFKNEKSKTNLALATTILALTYLIHPWTWIQYTSAIILYLAVRYGSLRKFPKNLALVLITIVVLKLAYELTMRSSIFEYSFILKTFLSQWSKPNITPVFLISNLYTSLTIYMWGTLNNPVYSILNSYHIDKLNEQYTLSVLTVSGLATILLLTNTTFIFRTMLNIPFQLLIACYLSKTDKLEATAITLFLTAYSLRMLITSIPNNQLLQYLYI